MDPSSKREDAGGLDYTPEFHPGYYPDDDNSQVASEGEIVSDDEETQSVGCEIIENDASMGRERRETGVHTETTRQTTPIGRCRTEPTFENTEEGRYESDDNQKNDLEHELFTITEDYQPSSSSQSQRFVEPPPRPHGGKRMPVSAKKITRNDLQPDGKKKKRSSITSSSSSSSSSSAERSPSPKRKNQLSHERSKSRSRFSARSPTVPPPCPPESSDKRRGKDKAARTGANTSKGTRPQHPRTRPQHPPKATDAVTNELFETMRNRRPDSAPRAASLVSAMSSVFTTTHRPPRPLDLERCLLDTLRGKGLCTKSVVAMNTLVHTVRTRELVEATRSIMYVSPDAAVQKPPPTDYPTFDPYNYLFCDKAQSFGYDYRTLYYNQHLRESSLTHALKPGCKRDPQKMSLDLVFRKALKEIAEELHEIDPEPLVISLENPVFINGRYLELKLLNKMGEFYRVQCNGLDLSKYLTQSSTDKTSPLKQYVEGSRCEEYVRVLHDRYALNSGANLINAKAKSLIMPSSMRVWTDVETQASASLRMYNHIQTLFEKAKTINNANTKGADDIASSITRFTETYAKHMGYFMNHHGRGVGGNHHNGHERHDGQRQLGEYMHMLELPSGLYDHRAADQRNCTAPAASRG
ncbi:hypothetical protein J6590_096385 [Homalodisca vitripennis]|nr:hypothetical protein J6590_096385 [Homalodisca vitripennis]